jgi:hypothetical protein
MALQRPGRVGSNLAHTIYSFSQQSVSHLFIQSFIHERRSWVEIDIVSSSNLAC